MKKPNSSTSKTSAESLPAQCQAPLLYLTVFLVFSGQMLLNPIIAPLSREMGLAEWHIGLTISLSALAAALLSPLWGRRSQSLGVKRVLLVAMTVATIALSLFAVVSYLGVEQIWVGPGLVVGVVCTRGLFYGCAISGVVPSAQAHLVANTSTEGQRVKAVGGIGAMTGAASMVGGVLGGALAAVGGILAPLVVMPLLMIAGIVFFAWKFKASEGGRGTLPLRIKYTDPRVFAFMVTGFVMMFVFSALQTIFGFTIQDRFGLGPETTAGVTALYLVTMTVVMVVVQAVVVPRTGWSAVVLLRRGLAIIALGVALLWPTDSYALMAVGTALLGVGVGFAMPGYTAGPTMFMKTNEQGSLAGLTNANNSAAYAVAPVIFTLFYGWSHVLPFIFAVVLIVAACVFTFSHPTLRRS